MSHVSRFNHPDERKSCVNIIPQESKIINFNNTLMASQVEKNIYIKLDLSWILFHSYTIQLWIFRSGQFNDVACW